MMHCDGKCYLAKQLKKIEQKEQQHNSKTNPFSGLLKIDWMHVRNESMKITFEEEHKAQNLISYQTVALRDYSNSVFHPPA